MLEPLICKDQGEIDFGTMPELSYGSHHISKTLAFTAHKWGQNINDLHQEGAAGMSVSPKRLQQDSTQKLQARSTKLFAWLQLCHVVPAYDEHLHRMPQRDTQCLMPWSPVAATTTSKGVAEEYPTTTSLIQYFLKGYLGLSEVSQTFPTDQSYCHTD